MTDVTLEGIQQSINALLMQRDDDLWSADEIALHLKLSKKTVQNHYLSHPTFPEPVKLLTGGMRWVAKEVRAWALVNR